MRSEHRVRRMGRHLGAAAVLVALALATGCDDGSFTADKGGAGAGVGGGGAAPAPLEAGPRTYPETGTTAGAAAGTEAADGGSANPGTAASLPHELVGSWSGDDAQGVGSWTLEFSSDGHFAQYNIRRGVTRVGQAATAGSRLYLQPQDGDSQTVTWEVDGGRLSLDGDVYLRTGSGASDGTAQVGTSQDATALVGSWIGETNTWQTLTFNEDGTWSFEDPSSGTSSGRYTVSGDQLNTGRSSYTWSVDGAQLQLGLPNGQTATYSRIG